VCQTAAVLTVAPGVSLIDTLLHGFPGVTGTILVEGDRPAIIDTGPETSAAVLLAGLREAGLGPGDLAWIVLTHVHLDHCGATGAVAAAFPNATVVVHRRGVKHLIDPSRLVAGSAAVYRDKANLYGGLGPVAEDRIVEAPDGHRVSIGAGHDLVMIEAFGHARHHMAVLDEGSGTLVAGDALGMRLPNAGLYPTMPPSDIDIAMGRATVARLAETRPATVCVGHFGVSPDAEWTIATADEQWRIAGEAAAAGWAEGGREGVRRELGRRLPPEELVKDPAALATLGRLGWLDDNVDGLAGWAEARAAAEAEAQPS
jgi:glyoxylase-like metal-dependent hydrolase (beta-lactamase superfamily II)